MCAGAAQFNFWEFQILLGFHPIYSGSRLEKHAGSSGEEETEEIQTKGKMGLNCQRLCLALHSCRLQFPGNKGMQDVRGSIQPRGADGACCHQDSSLFLTSSLPQPHFPPQHLHPLFALVFLPAPSPDIPWEGPFSQLVPLVLENFLQFIHSREPCHGFRESL